MYYGEKDKKISFRVNGVFFNKALKKFNEEKNAERKKKGSYWTHSYTASEFITELIKNYTDTKK